MVATISALVHHWDMIRGSDGRASTLDGGLSEFVLAKGTCCSQRTSPPTAGDSRFGSWLCENALAAGLARSDFSREAAVGLPSKFKEFGTGPSGAAHGRFAHPVGKTQVCSVKRLGECRSSSGAAAKACLHRCQQPLHPDDVDDAREIVGEHVQRH